MKSLAVLSQKGGVGKTTTCLLLAVEAERRRKGPVAVLDLDPQASASGWGDSRKAAKPAIQAVPAARLGAALEAIKAAGCRLAILDTPPQAEGPALAAARAAEGVLIPVRPNILDLRAIGSTVEIARLAGKPAAILLCQGAPGAKLADARDALTVYGLPVSPVALSARVLHSAAMIEGRTAAEAEPDGKAAAETKALFDWLTRQGLL